MNNYTLTNVSLNLFRSDLNNAHILRKAQETIEKYWKGKKIRKAKIIENEQIEMILEFKAKIIISMKKLHEKAKKLLNEGKDFLVGDGDGYETRVRTGFNMEIKRMWQDYRIWKKDFKKTGSNKLIPEFVFIQNN